VIGLLLYGCFASTPESTAFRRAPEASDFALQQTYYAANTSVLQFKLDPKRLAHYDVLARLCLFTRLDNLVRRLDDFFG